MKTKAYASARSGFTLIELLVVIAIIGLLAAVVLAAVGTARRKGVDTAVKSQMHNARTQAEFWYSNHTSYAGVCAATQSAGGLGGAAAGGILANLLSQTAKEGGAVQTGTPYATLGLWNDVICSESADGTSYMIAAPLVADVSATPSLWCVDSNSAAKVESAVIPANSVVCP